MQKEICSFTIQKLKVFDKIHTCEWILENFSTPAELCFVQHLQFYRYKKYVVTAAE